MCNFSFLQNRNETFKRIYDLQDSDFEADYSKYTDKVFIFIHVTEDGSIANMPYNLTIHLHHNTTILDALIRNKPDELSL